MTMVVSSAGSQCNEIVTDGSCMLEDDWNLEAANMIEEVLRTQQEVSALLAKNTNVTSELQALKESCSKDLQQLQDDAWKLQMYAELERMSRQLELLEPLAPSTSGGDDTGESSSHVGEAAKTAAAAADSYDVDETKLQDFDDEITALNKQIYEAKKEMEAMLQMKVNLEKELQSLQLEGSNEG